MAHWGKALAAKLDVLRLRRQLTSKSCPLTCAPVPWCMPKLTSSPLNDCMFLKVIDSDLIFQTVDSSSDTLVITKDGKRKFKPNLFF